MTNLILVGAGLFLVLLVGSFLAIYFIRHFGQKPRYLRILPPEGTTFPGGRSTLGFAIDYEDNAPEDDFTSCNLFDAGESGNMENACLRVPRRARLFSVLVMYDNCVANGFAKGFWTSELQLSPMTSNGNRDKKITAILLNFKIPGDFVDITRQFKLQ